MLDHKDNVYRVCKTMIRIILLFLLSFCLRVADPIGSASHWPQMSALSSARLIVGGISGGNRWEGKIV